MGRGLVWEIGDYQIGAKNTESDGSTPRGKGLLVRGGEFSSRLASQEPPLLWKISDVIYHFLWFILLPTLVSHPCLYLSVRLIDHSF